MNDTDRKDFADKMIEMSKALGRVIDDEDIGAYFNQLQDLPLDLIIKGIDHAIRERDPGDEFATALINVPEIRGAVARIIREERGEVAVAGCKACNMTGWILAEGDKGQPLARPCTCLYEIAKRFIKTIEKPTAKEVQSIKSAQDTVRAYESHTEKEKKDE